MSELPRAAVGAVNGPDGVDAAGRGARRVWRGVKRVMIDTGWHLAIAGMLLGPTVSPELLRSRYPLNPLDLPEGPEPADGEIWPERLIPDVEPSAEERQLWAQLEDLDDLDDLEDWE